MEAVTGIFGLTLWGVILARWRLGIWGLVCYLPFSGIVTLALYPSPWPVLFKDVAFILPAYFGYLLDLSIRELPMRVPALILGQMSALAMLVICQMFNPRGAGGLVALVGAKVWLFYLPLTVLGAEWIRDRSRLVLACRTMSLMAWIPCLAGIGEWIAILTYGYRPAMEALLGGGAAAATQGFVSFEPGVFRIPGTFTFPAQYLNFVLSMMAPAYALRRLELSPSWSAFAGITLLLLALAAFMSGVRAAFVMVPLLLGVAYALDGGVSTLVKPVTLLVAAFAMAVTITRMDLAGLVAMVGEAAQAHVETVVVGGLTDAFGKTLLGRGTGVNTGQARYVVEDPIHGFFTLENYYAKAVLELGVLGLVLVVSLFTSLVVLGHKNRLRLRDRGLSSWNAAVVALIITFIIYDLKGSIIDLDPANVYVWLFAGTLFRLSYLSVGSPVARR